MNIFKNYQNMDGQIQIAQIEEKHIFEMAYNQFEYYTRIDQEGNIRDTVGNCQRQFVRPKFQRFWLLFPSKHYFRWIDYLANFPKT